MKRNAAVFFVLFGSLISVNATSDRAADFGEPIPGLTPEQAAAFSEGREAFEESEDVADGLGPVFNEASCAACHMGPGSAIGGSNGRLETRFGTLTDGKFDPLASLGGSLLQDHSIGKIGDYEYVAEKVPDAATIVAGRRTTPLFGLGLVDAVPDGDFYLMALQEVQRNDGTAGRVHLVNDMVHHTMAVGRFGWKAQVPNLLQFSGDAYLNEMGITNIRFPAENCPQGDCSTLANNPRPDINDATDEDVDKFADFMTMLAPPPRGPITGQVIAGENMFEKIGCTSCHVATLHTGSSDIAALDNKPFHPYSDFLLHDMGSLGDGIEQGQASGREIRTAPLWGLRTINPLLHDGRAHTIDDAILAHDGQGRAARDRFAALEANEKSKLMAFLNSL
jgi:CxxC motif-containing protein (DUF1111 family)